MQSYSNCLDGLTKKAKGNRLAFLKNMISHKHLLLYSIISKRILNKIPIMDKIPFLAQIPEIQSFTATSSTPT